ncbi:MAG: DEAD/DEAH box helicase, partial [Deltaproteobacteria bacterium]|nr:DEAD/DEAH box helicase [Deltaproteobacteria bacterium]
DSSRCTFDAFDLSRDLMRGIRAIGFETPRPIQAETIPAGLEGRDVLGLAQTGTGKTAAFGLPILQRLIDEPGPGPLALILAPSRELATQIDAELRSLARHTRIASVTVFGGVSARAQISALRRRPEIVVGCPGRVLDLLQQGHLKLDEVETLVLDEADHMFDMGFLPDVRRIMNACPKDRQNLLFSATMPREIRKLADDLLHDPHVAELARSSPADTIDHALYPVPEIQKRELLERFLNEDDCTSAIVFTRTKHRTRRLAEQLAKAGHRAVGLQGNMSQGQRDRAMGGFRSGRYDVMVATDIAARGIDVSGISHVINFDVPNTPEAYTHRIGRTGRSGVEGRACTFVTREDGAWVRDTERMIGSPIQVRKVEGFDEVAFDRNGPRRKQGNSGNRPGSRQNGRPRQGQGQGRGSGSGRRSGGGGRRSGARR